MVEEGKQRDNMYGNGTHKELFIDIETSGTNAEQDAIIQIAGIIRIDGVEQERFSWYMYPSPGDRVSQEALDINNLTLEYLQEHGISQQQGYERFVSILESYIQKFDKSDKFFLKGWKVYFDMEFLSWWFIKNGDNYFFSWAHTLPWDVATYFITLFEDNFHLLPPKMNQSVAADFLQLPYNKDKLHDAVEDIDLSMRIYDKVKELYPHRFQVQSKT